MDELQIQVEDLRIKALTRRKLRYKLAKALGFKPIEAGVLAGKSEAYIKELAIERNNKNGKTDKARN